MHTRELFPNPLFEAAVEVISPQEAVDQKMFGPMYHGTQTDLSAIIATGFDTDRSIPSDTNSTSNGYSFEPYGQTGIAAPVHHLGFGAYFTTVKAIAKAYVGNTTKGRRAFYLASTNVEEINFGAPNTMMKWWRANGYNMTSDDTRARNYKAWLEATNNLTKTLSARADAVWFLGKGIRKLLDGDQVCIYDTSLIRVVDPKRATGLQVGAKVTHTQVLKQRFRGSNSLYVDDLKPADFMTAGRLAGTGWRGVYRGDEEPHPTIGRYPVHFIPPPGMIGIITRAPTEPGGWFSVKWKKGGEMYNYTREELQPAP